MLWSLIKILLFVAVVTALTWGAVELLALEGGATVSAMGYEVTLNPLQVVIALAAFLLLAWVVWKLIKLLVAVVHFLNGDDTAISRYFTRNRERRGFDALSEGMLALASGEGRVALAKAQKADRFLNRPELTTVLTAQAAEVAGDRKTAERSYKALLKDNRTRFVGVRGLMKQRLDQGDTDTALKLAEKAFALKPAHDETSTTLLRLQAEREDWTGARKTLQAKHKHGTLPRDVHRRRDAVLALGQAKEIAAEGKTVDAREAAIEANRLSPDLVPAAVMAARGYIEAANPKNAARVIKAAWEKQPHPDLAAAFAEIKPDETPEQRLKRFRALTKIKPDHPESRMLQAELLIAAGDFPAARRALGDLVTSDPTSRSLAIMAAVERGEGASDQIVRGWLARALTAPRGPQWTCDNCHYVHTDWAPVCDNCHAVDTLTWQRPPRAEVSMPAGAEMLPLIVGDAGPGAPGRDVSVADDSADTREAEDAEEADTPEDPETEERK